VRARGAARVGPGCRIGRVEEAIVKHTMLALASVVAVVCASANPVKTQSPAPLAIPGYEAARDLPGAHELPNPETDYKVLFSVGADSKSPNEVHQMLPAIATYVNTLAKYKVPPSHRHIVVMFHQRSADFDMILSNDAYKARYEGRENPNAALIHALKQAGVDLRACGQGLFARKIDPKDVNPDIQIDLWAMTSMINLQLKGYVRIG
jgi:intracellular sulfur oxidation DsrE/DsrF family protein